MFPSSNSGQSLVIFLVLVPVFLSLVCFAILSFQFKVKWQEIHFFNCKPALEVQYRFVKTIRHLLRLNKQVRLNRKMKKAAKLVLATSTNPAQMKLAIQALKKIAQSDKLIKLQQKLLLSESKVSAVKVLNSASTSFSKKYSGKMLFKIPQLSLVKDSKEPPLYRVQKDISKKQVVGVKSITPVLYFLGMAPKMVGFLSFDKKSNIEVSCASSVLDAKQLQVSLWKL